MANTEALINIILLAISPMVESRGAIPYGLANGVDLPSTLLLSLFGNMLPVPFLLLTFKSIERWIMSKDEKNFLKRVFTRYIKNLRERASVVVNEYGFIGLVIFVAIPIPGTGAWTGGVVAQIFGIDFKKSLLAILVGVIIAIFIITATVLGVINIIK